MSETIKVEIPIEAKDNTAAGVESAKKRFKGLEEQAERLSRTLSNMGRSKIEISAEDNASEKINDISDKTEQVNGIEAQVSVGINNNATQAIENVKDSVRGINGTSADAEIGVYDHATPIVSAAQDAVEGFEGAAGSAEITVDSDVAEIVYNSMDSVEMFDGIESLAYISADDNASPIVDAAKDKVEGFGGVSGTSEIDAYDAASPVIDAAMDKAESWAGSVFNATIGVMDAVTSPIGAAVSAVQNPIAQGAGILGVSLGVADSVDGFKDFESAMSQVKAISGASGYEFDALTAKAKQMGADTKYSAVEAAEAFNYMSMAGWKTGDMMDGIEGIMNLAAASGESLGATSDIVTDALTAFGLTAGDAAHFSDVLAQASANANTNVGMLGESFKYVAPVAGAMNYSIEDTSLALGLMANSSIKGSMAGTALKTSLANMVAPTDSMAIAMNKYGISLADSQGNMKSLGEVITNLRSSLGGLSEDEQTAAASTIFGKEAMAGMLAIINASESDYNKLKNAIYDADGAAQQMADTMMDNLGGSLELLSGAVDEVQMALGERFSPYIRTIADGLAEQMPDVKNLVNDIMDFVDGKAQGITNIMSAMTNSKEWQNTDFTGKINIVWDKLIAEPFSEWAGTDGVHMISEGITGLLKSAGNVVTGQAGVTDWLGTAVLAKGTATAAKGIMSLAESIGVLSPALGSAVPLIGATAAGIIAIGSAIDSYNQHQINTSLEEHFGHVALSAKQAQEVAGAILDAKYIVNVEAALGEVRNADALREDAEAALAANDTLEWKCSIGMILDDGESQSYMDNINTYIESSIKALESQTHAANIMIDMAPKTAEGQSLASKISQWAADDLSDMSVLSSKLTRRVQNALTDGIIDVDEQEAINALQSKMNSIMSGWKQAESQAEMDLIEQKYGRMSGKDITSESFTEIVDALQQQRESAAESLDATSREYYSTLNAMEGQGRISGSESDVLKSQWRTAVRNQQGLDIAKSLDFENNTLSDAYGEKLSENFSTMEADTSKYIGNLSNYLKNGDYQNLQTDLSNGFNAAIVESGLFSSGDQKALASLYETMKPDVSAMSDIIDHANELGEAVPREVMDSYNQAMQIGAASGDVDAGWAVFAKSIMDSGDKALIEGISSGELSAPEELRTALERQLAEVTDDPLTLNDAEAKLENVNVDSEGAKSAIEEAMNSLTAEGAEFSVTAEGVTVDLTNVDIDSETAMAQIEAALGMESGALNTAGISVESGATVSIPADMVTVDTSGIEAAIAENTSEGTETSPVESNADVNVNAGNVDSSSAVEQAAEETQSAFDNPTKTDGSADITLTQTNNVDAIYSEVDGQVQSAFSAGYSTSADVAVTLNWSIVNPTASISVGGAGTGSASVSASLHADGGVFDTPHLGIVAEDGPEAIIPLGGKRRSRGLELWQAAGEALGVAHADGGMFGSGLGVVDSMQEYASESDTATGVDYNNEVEDYSRYLQNSDSWSNSGSVSVQAPVNVSLSPTINIDGGQGGQDEEKVVEIIRKHLDEMIDEIGGEIGERLSMIFDNMPLAGGVS